jgi:hypothetical protein
MTSPLPVARASKRPSGFCFQRKAVVWRAHRGNIRLVWTVVSRNPGEFPIRRPNPEFAAGQRNPLSPEIALPLQGGISSRPMQTERLPVGLPWLQQPFPCRCRHRVCSSLDPELVEDRGQVVIHGLGGEEEVLRDGLTGEPLSHQT